MHSSHLSRYVSDAPVSSSIKGWRLWITWLCRIAFGATFTVSGFVKAVDPWGSIYKFEEYLAAMGLHLLPNLIIIGVFALCTLEFMIGIFIVLGCYRKSTPVLALMFMSVMLPVTLWIAISNPVADCGCFGDFWIISNYATFFKNVILSAMAIWLVIYNKKSTALITPAIQWTAVVASIFYINIIGLYGFIRQPLIDFRPYPNGGTLIDQDIDDDESTDFQFIYKKNGETRTFGINDVLPSEDEGWEFVERREIFKENSSLQKSKKTFRIFDIEGNDDLTIDVISEESDMIILLIPDLYDVSPKTTWKINALYKASTAQNIDFIAVVAAHSDDINEWIDLSMPEYDIYSADDTAIKEIARGNPAVIYLKDGIIQWKSTLDAIDSGQITLKNSKFDPQLLAHDDEATLKNCTLIYISILVLLLALSLLPRIAFVKTHFKRNKKKDSMGRPGIKIK